MNITAYAAISEGRADYSNELSDTLSPLLIAALAASEPAWVREARRECAAYDCVDWGYEEWKLERDFAQAEREYDEVHARMDDDGAPAYDWQVWS